MSYRIELRNCLIGIEDGFSGTAEIDDSSISASDTSLLLDPTTVDLHDDVTVVPVGARFTTAGIDTIRTVTAQNANAQWQVTIGADTTGTYTLTFEGQTTAPINGTATASEIQTALENLSNVTAGDLLVSGTDPFTIEARGDYLGLAGLTMTATPTDLDNFAFATVQDGGTTWSVDFTPALASGSLPTTGDVVTFLPQRVFMKTGDGNFEATENSEFIYDKDRGKLDGVREGDEQPMDITTAFVFSFLTASSGGAITVYEALTRTGGAAEWHNAASDPCEPYCVNIFIIHRPPCGSEQAEVVTFPEFRPNSKGMNIRDANISLQGQCNATKAVPTREDSSVYADLFSD